MHVRLCLALRAFMRVILQLGERQIEHVSSVCLLMIRVVNFVIDGQLDGLF